MTAKQIIDQIQDLSSEDRAKVIDFIKALDDASDEGVNYADDASFQAALSRVMEEDSALLKKLAE